MAGFFDDVNAGVNPFTIAQRMGLNVPPWETVKASLMPIASFFGPQADVQGMVQDAAAGNQAMTQGDFMGALGNYGMAAAAIPMMALPGTIGNAKGIGRLLSGRPGLGSQEVEYLKAKMPKDFEVIPEADRFKMAEGLLVQRKAEIAAGYAAERAQREAFDAARKARNESEAQKVQGFVDAGLWRKDFAERAMADLKYDLGFDEAAKANLEAIPRLLKAEGWTVRHASKSGGRQSSRYLIAPDGKYEVRLSDHYLPDTPKRQAGYTGDWDDEVVLSRGIDDPREIIERIKASWMGE